MKPGLAARSLFVWAATWLYMAMAALVAVPWTLVTGRLGFLYAAARTGLRLLFWLAGIRLVEHGRDLLPDGGCVYMPNHQSNLDPPILLACLPGQVSFLAKQELFRLPVLGAVARVGGLIPIDRRDRAAAHASLARAAAAVRNGRPFLVFPEGTRSPDGRLLPFKKGPFFLTEAAARPVVPITLTGTARLMPKGDWRIRPGRVDLTYHRVIPPGGRTRDQMAEAVRAAIAASLP